MWVLVGALLSDFQGMGAVSSSTYHVAPIKTEEFLTGPHRILTITDEGACLLYFQAHEYTYGGL